MRRLCHWHGALGPPTRVRNHAASDHVTLDLGDHSSTWLSHENNVGVKCRFVDLRGYASDDARRNWTSLEKDPLPGFSQGVIRNQAD